MERKVSKITVDIERDADLFFAALDQAIGRAEAGLMVPNAHALVLSGVVLSVAMTQPDRPPVDLLSLMTNGVADRDWVANWILSGDTPYPQNMAVALQALRAHLQELYAAVKQDLEHKLEKLRELCPPDPNIEEYMK